MCGVHGGVPPIFISRAQHVPKVRPARDMLTHSRLESLAVPVTMCLTSRPSMKPGSSWPVPHPGTHVSESSQGSGGLSKPAPAAFLGLHASSFLLEGHLTAVPASSPMPEQIQ